MNFVCAPKKHNGFNYCDFREKKYDSDLQSQNISQSACVLYG